MTLTLYFHPFSSFCQKVLTALYERDVPFVPRIVDLGDPDERAMLAALWPMGKFPVLHDSAAGRTIPESSVVVEYLDRFGAAPPLVPHEQDAALDVRLWDRLFDLYVDVQLQKAVGDRLRPEDDRDPYGVDEARATLGRAYGAIEAQLERDGGEWICGDSFTLADCAAAPALFYANIVAPFSGHPHLNAYYQRLLARPSFARAVDEARPYRHFFPLEWPKGY